MREVDLVKKILENVRNELVKVSGSELVDGLHVVKMVEGYFNGLSVKMLIKEAKQEANDCDGKEDESLAKVRETLTGSERAISDFVMN